MRSGKPGRLGLGRHHATRRGAANSRTLSTTRLVLMALGSATVLFLTTSLVFMHDSPLVKKDFGPGQFVTMVKENEEEREEGRDGLTHEFVEVGREGGEGVVSKGQKLFDKWLHKAAGAGKGAVASRETEEEVVGQEKENDEEDDERGEEKVEKQKEWTEAFSEKEDEEASLTALQKEEARKEEEEEEEEKEKAKEEGPEGREKEKFEELHDALGASSTLPGSELQGFKEQQQQGNKGTPLRLLPTKKGTAVRSIPSAPPGETCQVYLKREDTLAYERDFVETPIRVHQYGGGYLERGEERGGGR